MTSHMKAAVVREFGRPLSIEEGPVPEVGPGDILVNVKASGVCHTDLHAADGDWPVKPSLPFIPGHEGVGYVAAVGNGVKTVKEGDRVGVPWLYTACGQCEHCLSGRPSVTNRRTRVTRSTADMPNTCSPIPTTLGIFPITSLSMKLHRYLVPASPSTKAFA